MTPGVQYLNTDDIAPGVVVKDQAGSVFLALLNRNRFEADVQRIRFGIISDFH